MIETAGLSERTEVTEALIAGMPVHFDRTLAQDNPHLQIVDKESLQKVVDSAYKAGCLATVRSMQETAAEIGMEVDITQLFAIAESRAHLGFEQDQA